ncbi:MAG: DnaJ domain-containing protein [Bacteroidales bacterium]|nr:DnaJ domain-containing protein [Bacteroidales bacterium]
MDYYAILGVSRDATIDEVKRSYRRLARKYHPDVNPSPDAQERFIAVTEAYEFIIRQLTQASVSPSSRDYSYESNREAQAIIDEWLKAERERIRARARKHARMRYSQFKQTEYFKATDTRQNQIVASMAILVGIFVVIGSVKGTLKVITENEELRNVNYLGSFVIIFIVGIILIAVGSVRLINPLWKKWHRKKTTQ